MPHLPSNRARDIPLHVLLGIARRQRDRALEESPEATRFRNCEANQVARLDAVIGWLETVPMSEWADEYLEIRR